METNSGEKVEEEGIYTPKLELLIGKCDFGVWLQSRGEAERLKAHLWGQAS